MKDYRGVKWMPELNRWQSMLRHKGVTYNCGLHIEQKDAAKARDTTIIKNGLNVELQVLTPLKK
ncbi:MAG: hypothetical protein V4666_08290 [Bacteroidota bacterium]